jgi:hypothetical protein
VRDPAHPIVFPPEKLCRSCGISRFWIKTLGSAPDRLPALIGRLATQPEITLLKKEGEA